MFQGFFDEALPNTLMSLSRIYLQSNLMADATAADPSVGVWEQLHCFFFAWRNSSRNRSWGFPSWLRPGTGLAPTVKGPSPSSLPRPPQSKEETVELLPHANGGVGGLLTSNVLGDSRRDPSRILISEKRTNNSNK